MSKDVCPVCSMTGVYSEFSSQYHKMYFYFCSEQCRDNFNKRPVLYLKSSIKDTDDVKHRDIHLSKPIPENTVEFVKSVLMALMGVHSVEINDKNVRISYDLKQIQEVTIEKALTEIELAIENNWFERIRRRMIQQHEENELDNIASSAPCCNKAPPKT